ncbi:MAG: F0F1 ATP synthase subunit B [Alphaproteobacteria bacterium]
MDALLHDTSFWVAIGFVIFLLIVWRPGKRAILGFLDTRTAAIRSEIDNARKLREEAQHALAEYQRRQHDAAREAETIVAQAAEEAGRLQERLTRQMEDSLARREAQARDRIAQAEDAARQHVRAAAIDLAVDAARTLLAAEAAAQLDRSLVRETISQLPDRVTAA